MSLQFKREHRYFVFKVKNLTQDQQQRLFDFEMELGPRNSVGECVVVESEWPNYLETWDSIRDVSCGTFKPREVLVAERNALAKEVDAANDRIGELTKERDDLAAKLALAEADVLQREAQLLLTAHEAPGFQLSERTKAMLKEVGGIMLTRAALARAKAQGGVE